MPAGSALIAQERGNWAPAGDNLFIDLDLMPGNTPPGTRLAIGTAVIEIAGTPHNGCESLIARYGRDACLFVNTREGKRLRLRGHLWAGRARRPRQRRRHREKADRSHTGSGLIGLDGYRSTKASRCTIFGKGRKAVVACPP